MLFYELVIINLDINIDEVLLNLNFYKSFLHVKVHIIDYTPFLSINLFGKQIYSKAIKKSGKRKMKMKYYPALDLHGMYANVYYGFDNPFFTGISSGVIQIIQIYFNGIYIAQFPDFLAQKEYIRINAGGKLNMGKTIVNILRIKFTNKNRRRKLLWINSI
jgi:hypothetical protein